jgi:hypothetical protein
MFIYLGTVCPQMMPPVQLGLDSQWLSLVGIAGAVVLAMIVLAGGAFVYKASTGTLTWPTDTPENPEGDDSLNRGDSDDEWDYY